MKYKATVHLTISARDQESAENKLYQIIKYGLEETVATAPPKGVAFVDCDVTIAPPEVKGNPTFEVTVVKTAGMTISLEEAQALLMELDEPHELSNYEGDPKQLVEVAISNAEGRNLDLSFDREIFVIQSTTQGEQP